MPRSEIGFALPGPGVDAKLPTFDPKRDVFVGGAAKMMSAGGFNMPGLFDRYMRRSIFKQRPSGTPNSPTRRDALHAPGAELRERQGMAARVAEHCPYTAVALRSKPLVSALLGGGALFAAWTLGRRLLAR